jgi:subtilisin family serine protease
VLALVVAPGAAHAADKAPLIGEGKQGQIKDQYIVVLKDGATQADAERTKKQARDAGGDVKHEYDSALKGFSAKLTPKALAALRQDTDVAFVEADAVVTADWTGIQAGATWGLDRIDQPTLPLNASYNYHQNGAGVKAYVIDTGIRTTHKEFGGRAGGGATAIADGRGAQDCNGHGTHVAGTIGGATYGVAKAVSLVPVRVLDCSGSGSMSGVIAGVNWVTNDHAAGQPAVANMSLGGGVSAALDQAVAASIADGVTYAIAAGNSNADACNYSPARTPAAITVGATTSTDARASFSNYGGCVDLFAPGQSITSAWATSNTATNTISGTSMATPHVAGVAALFLSRYTTTDPATLRDRLVNDASANVLAGVGTGSPNLLLWVPRDLETP